MTQTTDYPTLGPGYDNSVAWVGYLQTMINYASGSLGLPQIAEDSAWGPHTERAVRAFQGSIELAVDGIVGPQTWAAINDTTDRAETADGAAYAQGGAAGTHGGGANHAGGAQPGTGDPPPDYFAIATARPLLDWDIAEIVGAATEFAESVSGLGPPDEVRGKLIELAHTGLLINDIFDLADGTALEGALFYAGIGAAIVAPFAMWYEAIGANNAGDLHSLRWQVYHPFMDGFLAGLHGTAPAGQDPLFAAVTEHGRVRGEALGSFKNAALAILLYEAGAIDELPDADNPTIDARKWRQSGADYSTTWYGLENLITHIDS